MPHPPHFSQVKLTILSNPLLTAAEAEALDQKPFVGPGCHLSLLIASVCNSKQVSIALRNTVFFFLCTNTQITNSNYGVVICTKICRHIMYVKCSLADVLSVTVPPG